MFSADTAAALRAAAALVDTEASASKSDLEELLTPADVAAFFDAHGYTGLHEGTDDEVRRLRALRAELRAFFMEDRAAAAAHVNRVLAEEHALPRLVRHGGVDWHLHAVDDDAPLDTRVRVETAMAVLDLVRADELDRLGVCGADDCTALFVDESRNRSKRFCDVGNCGNRTNVNAYRARRAATPRKSVGTPAVMGPPERQEF